MLQSDDLSDKEAAFGVLKNVIRYFFHFSLSFLLVKSMTTPNKEFFAKEGGILTLIELLHKDLSKTELPSGIEEKEKDKYYTKLKQDAA